MRWRKEGYLWKGKASREIEVEQARSESVSESVMYNLRAPGRAMGVEVAHDDVVTTIV